MSRYRWLSLLLPQTLSSQHSAYRGRGRRADIHQTCRTSPAPHIFDFRVRLLQPVQGGPCFPPLFQRTSYFICAPSLSRTITSFRTSYIKAYTLFLCITRHFSIAVGLLTSNRRNNIKVSGVQSFHIKAKHQIGSIPDGRDPFDDLRFVFFNVKMRGSWASRPLRVHTSYVMV